MSDPNPKLDSYFEKSDKWQAEERALRSIVLDCQLDEVMKWMHPCYTHDKRNIVLIHAFKDYCALLFFKGALMKDPHNLLIQQTENVQSGRQIRFTKLSEITNNIAILKDYIADAIKVETLGLKVEMKKTEQFHVPEEFRIILEEMPELKDAFYALTPGRQRAYLLHFAGAKQASTRQARIEKFIPKIMDGLGFLD